MGSQATPPNVLSSIDLDLPGHSSGKVREAWRLSDQRRLLITTDRISAFDRVIAAVPHKGQVLNQLSAWWFARTSDIVANHVLELPDPVALVVGAEGTGLSRLVRERCDVVVRIPIDRDTESLNVSVAAGIALYAAGAARR